MIRTYYEQQVRALHNQGVRFFAFETIPTLTEAIYAKELLEEIGCDGWIAVNCQVNIDLLLINLENLGSFTFG